MDIEIVNENQKSNEDVEMPKRARSIAELEEKLEKIKSQKKLSFKNKLQKKSLSSKLNKKIKKTERVKAKVKPVVDKPFAEMLKSSVEEKPKPNIAKPVFNNEGKLVFSKFDFANVGKRGNFFNFFLVMIAAGQRLPYQFCYTLLMFTHL